MRVDLLMFLILIVIDGDFEDFCEIKLDFGEL